MKKKIITGILATLACCACLTGCDLLGPMGGLTLGPVEDASASKNLETAKNYIQSKYDTEITNGRKDLEVLNSSVYNDVQYTIDWTVDNENVTIEKDGNVSLIIVNKLLAEDLTYTLTATLTAPDGKTATATFKRVVYAAPEVPHAIKAAPQEDTAYHLFSYQAATSQALYVNGLTANDFYFGTTEDSSKAISIYVENTTDGFYLYNDESIAGKQYINMTTSDDDGRDKIHVAFQAEKSSVWTYSTEYNTIVTQYNNKTYYLGTTGTYTTFQSSTVSYINRENSYVGYLVEMDDRANVAETTKVAQTKKELFYPATYVGENVIRLEREGVMYPEAKITWALEGEGATLNGYKLTLNPTAASTIKLTATITNGETTDTKDILLNLVPNEPKAIVDAAHALAKDTAFGNEVTLTGMVTSITDKFNADYANVTVVIEVEGKEITCYRMKGEGADVVKPSDTITVTGIIKNYNGTIEFDSGCRMTNLVEGEGLPEYEIPEAGSTLTIPQAIELGEQFSKEQYTEGKYYVTGEITEISNTTYGNMKIKDADGNEISIYGSYDETGENAFNAMATQPKVGDTITIYGIIGMYNAPQIKNGWLVGYKAPAVVNPELSTTDPYKMHMNAKGNDETFEQYYITGEIASSKYLATTTVAANGKDIYAEKAENSYKFYIKNEDNSKSYIQLTDSNTSDSSAEISLVSATTSVFDYDSASKAWYTKVGSTSFYLGSYSTYTTIGASKKSFINAENTGVSQYPATLTLSSEFAPDDTATDAEKVAATVAEIPTLGKVYVGNATIADLPTAGVAYDDVEINWTVEGAGASYANGTLTFAPTATGTVTVTATVVKGAESDDSKSFSIKLVKDTPADIVAAAFDLTSGEAFANKVTLTGEITSIPYAYSTSKKNLTAVIAVENKEIECYKLSGTDADKIAVGDLITVNGIIKNYNGKIEFDSPNLVSYEVATAKEKTIEEALAIGKDLADYASSAPVKVTGTIINVKNAETGEMTIADENGNSIFVYKTDYSALTGKTLAFGNTVTLEGVVNKHKGDVQLKETTAKAIETPATVADIYKVYAVGCLLSVEKTNITENTTDTLTVSNADFTDITITWASNNVCAVISPANTVTYTLPAEKATVTLTATVKFSETVKKDYTFTVEVAAKPAEGTKTTTFDFKSALKPSAHESLLDNPKTVDGVTLSIVNTGGTSGSVPQINKSGYFQLYAGDSATLTVANANILSIKITFSSTGSYPIEDFVLDTETYNYTTADNVVTIVPKTDGTYSNSVTIKDGNTKQYQIQSIVVVYTA